MARRGGLWGVGGIATDSMVILDENAEKQERVDLLQATGSFFNQLVPMIQQYPAIAPFSMELLKYVTRSYRSGKELEGVLTNSMQAVVTQAQAAQEAQQNQANAPTPEIIRKEIAMLEIQDKQAEREFNLQMAEVKASTEQANMQTDLALSQHDKNLEALRLELEYSKHQTDTSFRTQEILLKAKELGIKEQNDSFVQEVDAMTKAHDAKMEELRVKNETFETKLGMIEKFQEERRLNAENAKPPVVNVHLPKSGAKKITSTRDAQGNLVAQMEELADG